LEDVEDETVDIQCPICAQKELLADARSHSGVRRLLDEKYFRPDGYSTKMHHLVYDLRKNMDTKKR
jgi:hypothetical protein